MVLYYAMGGGLGHLTRALAVIHTLHISDYKILSASPYADKMFNSSNLILLPVSMEKNLKLLKNRIRDIIRDLEPTSFFIDTFPMGIFGELETLKFPSNIKLNYISRILEFQKYMKGKDSPLQYDISYLIEEGLDSDHVEFIRRYSGIVKNLELEYPVNTIPEGYFESIPKSNQPIWMVMHSGSAEEVEVLIRHAREMAELETVNPFLWVVTQSEIEEKVDEKTTDMIPSYGLIPYVDRLFSACGFNMMYLTRNINIPHIFIPFPRKYDDQFRRARIRRDQLKCNN
ncbi:hypothetical protein ACFLU5_16035 [Bacteroidota bacterium]